MFSESNGKSNDFKGKGNSDDFQANGNGNGKSAGFKGTCKSEDAHGKGNGKSDDFKGKVDSEGRPLRCVHHWFAQCRNHPLTDDAKCRFGPHVGHPREDEKLRPEFLRMEGLHGKWEKNKFSYKVNAAAAKKSDGEELLGWSSISTSQSMVVVTTW